MNRGEARSFQLDAEIGPTYRLGMRLQGRPTTLFAVAWLVLQTASAQVATDDVAPAALVTKSLGTRVCADIKYKVKVENTSTAESVNLTALSDGGFGSLTLVHPKIPSTTCSVPQTIAKNGSYECKFTARFCGSVHRNQFSATVTDNESGSAVEVSNTLTIDLEAMAQP